MTLDFRNQNLSSWEEVYAVIDQRGYTIYGEYGKKKLKTLGLVRNRISDWEHFQPGSLKKLDLYHNQISDWRHFTLGSLTILWIDSTPLDNDTVTFDHIRKAYPVRLHLIRRRSLNRWIVRSRTRRLSSLLLFNRDSELYGDFYIEFSF